MRVTFYNWRQKCPVPERGKNKFNEKGMNLYETGDLNDVDFLDTQVEKTKVLIEKCCMDVSE